MSTVATNAANQTLISAIAAGFDQPSTRDLMIIAAYGAANGGAGGSGIPTGNYAGGQPNFTPTTAGALAIDSSNGTIWEWYNGAWQ